MSWPNQKLVDANQVNVPQPVLRKIALRVLKDGSGATLEVDGKTIGQIEISYSERGTLQYRSLNGKGHVIDLE